MVWSLGQPESVRSEFSEAIFDDVEVVVHWHSLHVLIEVPEHLVVLIGSQLRVVTVAVFVVTSKHLLILSDFKFQCFLKKRFFVQIV